MAGRSSCVVTVPHRKSASTIKVARAVLTGEEERVKKFWVLGHWEVLSYELARVAERGLLSWKARRETFWVLVLDGRGTGETSESIVSGMSQRRKFEVRGSKLRKPRTLVRPALSVRLSPRTQNSELRTSLPFPRGVEWIGEYFCCRRPRLRGETRWGKVPPLASSIWVTISSSALAIRPARGRSSVQ